MPMIGGVEVVHPRHGLLQIVWSRKRAKSRLVAILVGLLVIGAVMGRLAWSSGRDTTPGGQGARLVMLCLIGSPCVLLPLPALIRNARIAIWGEALTFSRETGKIERNGKILARLDDVAQVVVERTIPPQVSDPWSGPGVAYNYRLLIVLKDGRKLRICRVSQERQVVNRLTGLAEELAHILGVGVTLPQDVR